MPVSSDYCSFTKAVENLGDRWSMVIVRDLLLHGSMGFNAIAERLPGISRSVLAARLRKLELLGLIERDPSARRGVPGYQLTFAGRELRPVLHDLWAWSERFVPQDPAMIERDPDILPAWLSERLDRDHLPDRPVVLDMNVRGSGAERFWLVLVPGFDPSVCIEDPQIDDGRYVYLEADVPALYPVARGQRSMAAAVEDGSIRLFGEPDLVEAAPTWFRQEPTASSPVVSRGSVSG
jgi:DNA-binding HxlR family transcriptional regulator